MMETNNKLREALVNISKYADCAAMRQHDVNTQHYIEQIRKWSEAALAAPPRNCDVGTAEEQYGRWLAFCNSYDADCSGCPYEKLLGQTAHCLAKWAQLPYEEGGAK